MAADSPRKTASVCLNRRLGGILLAVAGASFIVTGFCSAYGNDEPKDGLFITVPNPITDTAVSQIELRIKDAVEREKRPIKVVVFDFNPNGKPAGTGNIYPCMNLKNLINKLNRGQYQKIGSVQTVAYVQEEVTDHTVLPVLACREIVMSSKGKLGHILGGPEALDKDGIQAYEEAAKPWAIPSLLPKMKELSKNASMFEVDEAQKIGLCKAKIETRQGVQDLYGLPPWSLREDALVGRTPIVWRIMVSGALNPSKLGSLERRINDAIREKANVIILDLDCDGGETIDALGMAEKLRNLTDFSGVWPVKTIAYVPAGRSLGAATFLALGCSDIVMHPEGKIGGFDYLRGTDAKDLAIKQKMLVELAKSQGYPEGAFQAMLDPAQFLSLDAKAAKERGIARFDDVTEAKVLYERYGIEPNQVQASRDNWLDNIAAFFRNPIVNILLITIGVAGLILELKIPGFGVPGIVAAICFVLFFWSHAFAGQSSWEFTLLAILLFILGLALLGVEIFLLPGFGVTGISGIVLIIVSLVLVLLEQMPSTSQQWLNVGGALMTVSVGLIAGMTAAFVIAHFLPSIPYANRLMLAPPEEPQHVAEVALTQEGLEASALMGAIGVARTTLRPAGTAQFGEQFLDVSAEGDFVNAGARVQVIQIEGNRIVVKEIQ
ncbi:MAG TPA: NfeD family protein [Gemmataceae bacterium]|nr:NfeD family protein [Gemmataceae bacterium]